MEVKQDNLVTELGYTTENKKGLTQVCLERKKIGWQMLKAWNENSKHNLLVSKGFIDDLYTRLMNSYSLSTNRYSTLEKFFKSVVLQLHSEVDFRDRMEEFQINPLNNTKKTTDLKTKEPLLNTVAEFAREFETFNKKLNEAVNKIKKEIGENIIKNSVTSFEESLKVILIKTTKMRKSLLKINNKTVDRLKKFQKALSENEQLIMKEKRTKINVFDFAFDFVQSVKYMDHSVMNYGMLLISVWEQCSILEEKRIGSIRQSLMKFCDILNEIYGSEAQKSFQNR